MKLRPLLSVFAIFVVVGGLFPLLAPGWTLSLYGVAGPTDLAIALHRIVGSMEIGVGVMAWLARGAEASPARKAVTVGLATFSGLSAVTVILAILGGLFNVFVWAPAVAYGLFAILFLAAGPFAKDPGA